MGQTGSGEDRQLLAAGFIGRPLMSSRRSGKISGPSSMGRPRPSKIRPSMSSLTPNSIVLPRKRTRLFERLMPVELSKSCTSALPSLISSTLQRRFSPFASSISASSSYVTFSTPFTSIRGPATSCMVLYSFGIRSPPCFQWLCQSAERALRRSHRIPRRPGRSPCI